VGIRVRPPTCSLNIEQFGETLVCAGPVSTVTLCGSYYSSGLISFQLVGLSDSLGFTWQKWEKGRTFMGDPRATASEPVGEAHTIT
jgi:hypothetical protein